MLTSLSVMPTVTSDLHSPPLVSALHSCCHCQTRSPRHEAGPLVILRADRAIANPSSVNKCQLNPEVLVLLCLIPKSCLSLRARLFHGEMSANLAMRSKLLSWNASARDCKAIQVAGGILPTMPKSMKPILPSRSTSKFPALATTDGHMAGTLVSTKFSSIHNRADGRH